MEIRGNTHQVTDGDRFPTAFVPAWDDPKPGEEDGTEEALANAYLISAAPDMLAALKRLCDYDRKPTQADWQAADAAIAKATGQAA